MTMQNFAIETVQWFWVINELTCFSADYYFLKRRFFLLRKKRKFNALKTNTTKMLHNMLIVIPEDISVLTISLSKPVKARVLYSSYWESD